MQFSIATIRAAAEETLESLCDTAGKAVYPFPKDGGYYSMHGYTYEIPKEEQCRSELFRHLVGKDGVCAVELEWNLYSPGMRQAYRVEGEIDLAVYGGNPSRLVALIEVKRQWSLTGWKNGLQNVEGDLDKLRSARMKVIEAGSSEPVVYGVVIFRFEDTAHGFPTDDGVEELAGPMLLYPDDSRFGDLVNFKVRACWRGLPC